MIVEHHWLRRCLEQEAAKPDPDLNLALCGLLIAAEEHPDLDIGGCLRQLDRFAQMVRARRSGDSPAATLEALRSCWTGLFGFAGNGQDYDDPRNSFLHLVLERRTGIPITLSIVFLEIGWRLGLPLAGVGLPGHFVVRHYDAEGTIYLDPFNGAELLDEDDCEELTRQAFGDRLAFRSEFLWPVSKRQILSRVLGNLKTIYQQQDPPRTLAVLDRMLMLDPDGPAELWERSRLYSTHRAFAFAQVDLGRLLHGNQPGADVAAARTELERLRRLWFN